MELYSKTGGLELIACVNCGVTHDKREMLRGYGGNLRCWWCNIEVEQAINELLHQLDTRIGGSNA